MAPTLRQESADNVSAASCSPVETACYSLTMKPPRPIGEPGGRLTDVVVKPDASRQDESVWNSVFRGQAPNIALSILRKSDLVSLQGLGTGLVIRCDRVQPATGHADICE